MGNLVKTVRTSLVDQSLKICLSVQGTQVQSLVWEDPTHLGATKPVFHNYCACVLQLLKPMHPGAHASQQEGHCYEKPVHPNKE